MKPQRKIYNFFFSTTLGAWCLAFLLALFFVTVSVAYLAYYVTLSGNLIKDLQPLAVIIIGIASVLIATSNYWEKKGHNITGRFIYSTMSNKNCTDVPCITDLILCNRKNKVEIIDKILLFSKKLGYTTLANFSQEPLALKKYETRIIPLKPVTAWVSGIIEEDVLEFKYINKFTGYKTIINTIKKGTRPKFYSTPYYYSYREIRMPKILAVISSGLIPVKLDAPQHDLQSILPIRNTDYPILEEQEEKMVYGSTLILATKLTLDRSEMGVEPKDKEIKVLLYNNAEKFYFDICINENPRHHVIFFLEIPTAETRGFEEQWRKYYDNGKIRYKKIFENKKNKEETYSYAQKLEDELHEETSHLFEKQDLPKISSQMASRILFLLTVKFFAEFPIVEKQNLLFATGFYPTEEVHPFFEEEEESIFAKIRKWRFRKTPRPSQETQEETNAETAKRTK